MKRTFAIFLSIAALLLAAAPLAGQEYPYKGGEKLSYTVHYKCGISADLAYVDLACTEDASSFSVKANVATYKFWDTFFKMRDTFETKFAKTGNRPISYHRDVTEGGYWARNWLTWSADASQYRSITEKKTRPRRDTVYRESEIVYDVINLIYKALVRQACPLSPRRGPRHLRLHCQGGGPRAEESGQDRHFQHRQACHRHRAAQCERAGGR